MPKACDAEQVDDGVAALRSVTFSEEVTFLSELYLPGSAGWKTPLPNPNTGPGRLKSAGSGVSTVTGGSGASKMPSVVRPGSAEVSCSDILELQCGRASGRVMLTSKGYLPGKAIWKTPSPVLNTGPGRLVETSEDSGFGATVSGG